MKPKRIFIVRHGQSEGNADKTVYNRKPDYALNLTEAGIKQAQQAAFRLAGEIGTETVGMYVSPYYRTRQTAQYLAELLNPAFYREDVRLVEQEWTTRLRAERKVDEEEERDAYSSFFFRFESGESCADVYTRLSSVLDTLHRDFEKKDFPQNVVIVGHGMTNRVFLMRWFHMTVEQFELLKNPENCAYYTLLLQSNGKYGLREVPAVYEGLRRKY